MTGVLKKEKGDLKQRGHEKTQRRHVKMKAEISDASTSQGKPKTSCSPKNSGEDWTEAHSEPLEGTAL